VGFDEAVAVLRSWIGEQVVVVLEPEGTVMRGALAESAADGGGSALFRLEGEGLTGVAIALFADGVRDATLTGRDELVIRQGRMTVRVTTCGGRRSAHD
jgi:hypothetical protein